MFSLFDTVNLMAMSSVHKLKILFETVVRVNLLCKCYCFMGAVVSICPAALVYCVYGPEVFMSAGGLLNCLLIVHAMLFATGVVCCLCGAEPADRSTAERRR